MTYLVTGASSGIGRATALRLAERGHQVVAGVRKIADAPEHDRIRPMALDVTDAEQLTAAAAQVEPLAGLVNVAGVTMAGPMEHMPLHRLREQFEVNVIGLTAVAQAFLPSVRAGGGRIVVMSSSAGRLTTPMLGAYSASKHAAESIADALRQELRPWRVPVVIIEPGSFKSRNRETTERTVLSDRSRMGEQAEGHYGRAMDILIEFNRNVEKNAGDPERVAAVVERALTARRPRARYVVGGDARAVLALAHLLPTRATDAVLCRAMGIHR